MKVNGARSKSKKEDQLVAAGALHVWLNITNEAIKKFKMAKKIVELWILYTLYL